MAQDLSLLNQPLEKLEQALTIKREIAKLEARLTSLFGGSSRVAAASGRPARGRRRLSAATRAKIAAAQRMRWAKTRGSEVSAKGARGAKSKGRKKGITAAGRKKLSDAMKARWAARKRMRKA